MGEFSKLSDLELLDLIRAGNRNAFTDLYNRYWERLFTAVLKVTKDDEESMDIVQEVFIAFWLKRWELTNIQSVSGYLYSAVRNRGLMFIRANIVRNNYLESLSHHFSELQDSVGEQQAVKELELIIQSELDKLPPKMREVYLLSRQENLSHKEIAERLNISDKTVKKQINNVLKHFRDKLDDKSVASISLLTLLIFRS